MSHEYQFEDFCRDVMAYVRWLKLADASLDKAGQVQGLVDLLNHQYDSEELRLGRWQAIWVSSHSLIFATSELRLAGLLSKSEDSNLEVMSCLYVSSVTKKSETLITPKDLVAMTQGVLLAKIRPDPTRN